jgi:hypothetical protein
VTTVARPVRSKSVRVTAPSGSRTWVTSPNALRPNVVTARTLAVATPPDQVVTAGSVVLTRLPSRS